MGQDLNLQVSRDGAVVVVALSGRLDGNTSGAFSAFLASNVREDDALVALDFSGLSYLSSAGLRELLKLAKRLNTHRRRPAIAAAQSSVSVVLEISGFTSLFHCTIDLPSAVKKLANEGSGKTGLLGRLWGEKAST
jgi:anti-sigma B factor antagonist